MRKAKWVRLLASALFGVTLSVLQSCGGGDTLESPQRLTIASIEISPKNTIVDPPGPAEYTAIARTADGSVVPDATFAWHSSNTTVATINDKGVATAMVPGITQVTAAASGLQSLPVTLIVRNVVAGPPPGSPLVMSGDVEGATERETSLTATLSPSAAAQYHFTFSDPFTRSVMFHNPFSDNKRNGEAVAVHAYYKVEGTSTWVEEDWSAYEWIGFCRDFKAQRLSDLVVVASAEGSTDVVAFRAPRLMRNVVGCWAFAGIAKRVTRHETWDPGGAITLTASVIFDINTEGGPNQYIDPTTGRLRVPMGAPMFREADWRLVEGYSEAGCSYSLDERRIDNTVTNGGFGFGSIVVNNFIDSMPASMRQQTVALNVTTSLAYTANGGSGFAGLNGPVGNPQPICGTRYDGTSPGRWLLTNDASSPTPIIDRLDGTLSGTFQKSDAAITDTFTWTLIPQRQP